MKKSEFGQALLIVLLVMAVGLTMGLAVVSRSVTDIRISQQEEESARAFSAAEAGIEEALLENLAVGASLSGPVGEIDYYVSSVEQGGSPEYDFGGGKFLSGDTQTVWLVGHDSDGNLNPSVTYTGSQIDLYWGSSDISLPGSGACSGNPLPALEASVIYDSGGYKVARYALDPDGARAANCNQFDSSGIGSAGYTLEGKSFKFKKTITLPAGTKYALRLKLLYNSDTPHILGVKAVGSGVTIPSQGKCYISTAVIEASGITRKVKQCQTYKAPPAIFDYVLFSGEDLKK
ncbi:MAG TPA: hypothetical protein VMX76_00065 [Nevskiaceae bacterium]|nr:hypothetical protein [Nevskiaceae bacterium]